MRGADSAHPPHINTFATGETAEYVCGEVRLVETAVLTAREIRSLPSATYYTPDFRIVNRGVLRQKADPDNRVSLLSGFRWARRRHPTMPRSGCKSGPRTATIQDTLLLKKRKVLRWIVEGFCNPFLSYPLGRYAVV